MLWYKDWLETRFIAIFMLAFAVFPIPLLTLTPHPANLPHLSLAQAEGTSRGISRCTIRSFRFSWPDRESRLDPRS